MYRTIDTAFWTDPTIQDLPSEGKLLCLYLITNPHAHVGGIYYLPDAIISLETGISDRVLHTLWDTLSSAGFCRRDKKTHVVWVVKMFFYQGRGEKNERAVANHLGGLHNSFLVKHFLLVYPSVNRYVKDRVSKGYPAQDEIGIQEQEQEQEPPIVPQGTLPKPGKPSRRKTKEQPPDYSEAFEKFWGLYPKQRREGKPKAFEAWKTACSRATSKGGKKYLLERIAAYAPFGVSKGNYCPQPATWLNQDRFDDSPEAWERETEREDPTPSQPPVKYLDAPRPKANAAQ